jgi:hypothetical protein
MRLAEQSWATQAVYVTCTIMVSQCDLFRDHGSEGEGAEGLSMKQRQRRGAVMPGDSG